MAKEKQAQAADETAAAFKIEKISFHAAILQSDGQFSTESFDTLPELVERIRGLIDRDVSVFAYAGERLRISKPPQRHLLVPGGAPIPLFVLPEKLEEDDSGYLGVDPIHLADPPQLKVPQGSKPPQSDDSDEFFPEDGGGALGVFDSVLPDPDS
jgi:hypothetical protein